MFLCWLEFVMISSSCLFFLLQLCGFFHLRESNLFFRHVEILWKWSYFYYCVVFCFKLVLVTFCAIRFRIMLIVNLLLKLYESYFPFFFLWLFQLILLDSVDGSYVHKVCLKRLSNEDTNLDCNKLQSILNRW